MSNKAHRYIGELLACKCTPDLLRMNVFPNAKEWTESFGAYAAVREHLWKHGFDPADSTVRLIAVGDGNSPRTGATFAMRTAWQCTSVDPRLRKISWPIKRLGCRRSLIQDYPLLPDAHPLLFVCVHSHATLEQTLQAVHAQHTGQVAVVAIPCCVPQDEMPPGGRAADIAYPDPGIWSPERIVRIWKDVR
jgi:hypothetical protein